MYYAAYAFDNKTNTRWSSNHEEPQFIGVVLSTSAAPLCDVQEVHITWETAYASHYSLLVTKDMKTWTEAYEGNPDNRPRPRTKKELKHIIPLGEHGKGIKAFKFDCKHRGTSWGFSVWAIKAFGKCGTQHEDL